MRPYNVEIAVRRLVGTPGHTERMSTVSADLSGDGMADVITEAAERPGAPRGRRGTDRVKPGALRPFAAAMVGAGEAVEGRFGPSDGLPLRTDSSGLGRNYLSFDLAQGVYVG